MPPLTMTPDSLELAVTSENLDVVDFTYWEVDAGSMRHISGPNKGELIFSELNGEYTPLWDFSRVKKSSWGDKKKVADDTQHKKEENIRAYAKLVESGEWEKGTPFSYATIHRM